MKSVLANIKYIIYGVVIIVVIGLAFKVYRYINPIPVVTIVMPQDTSGTPITHETYRPQSIPLVEHPTKPKVKLPSNLREKDVDRIITVIKAPHDTTYIVFPKKGDPYVDRESGKVLNVTITEYLDPILSWDWYLKIGLSGNLGQVSPMISMAFLRVYGRVDLPVFGLDLHGINAGIDYAVFDPFNIGIVQHVNWDLSREIRLILSYNL